MVDEAGDSEVQVTRAFAGVQGEPLADTKQIAVKLLISNAAAGIIIGRGGQNRAELQELSEARIQLSKKNEFYPGTTDRILHLSGTIKAVLTALYHALVKLCAGTGGEEAEPTRLSTQLKFIVPAQVCGAIIGRGGVTIKSFSVDSGANISVSPQEKGRGFEYDRIVTMSGSLDQLLRAVALVMAKVAENPVYMSNMGMFLDYASASGSQARPSSMAPPAAYPILSSSYGAQSVEVSMSVPDSKIGAILGKGGEILAGIKKVLNVKISISPRGEYEPGTTNRVVGVYGSGEDVQTALLLITQKVQHTMGST